MRSYFLGGKCSDIYRAEFFFKDSCYRVNFEIAKILELSKEVVPCSLQMDKMMTPISEAEDGGKGVLYR